MKNKYIKYTLLIILGYLLVADVGYRIRHEESRYDAFINLGAAVVWK